MMPLPQIAAQIWSFSREKFFFEIKFWWMFCWCILTYIVSGHFALHSKRCLFPTIKFSNKFGRRRQRSMNHSAKRIIVEASQLAVTGVVRASYMGASEVQTF